MIERDKTNMVVSIDQKSNLVEAARGLERWLTQNRLSVSKVKLLTGLIFLNIAGLHDYPYSKFLFNYGRLQLAQCQLG